MTPKSLQAMEKPSIPPIRFGKYSIPEPCLEPWEAMRPTDEQARLCSRCNKRVHDISGMTPSEIAALEARNGGSICGTFFLSRPPLDREPRKPRRITLPTWLKASAAAATLGAVLLQPPLLKAMTWRPSQDQPLPSTDSAVLSASPPLLSSVILNQNGENIEDDIVLILTFPDSRQQVITTQAGFYHLYLPDSVSATDSIQVLVPQQDFHDYSSDRTYPETRFSVSTANPQNISLTMNVLYRYHSMMRGMIRR